MKEKFSSPVGVGVLTILTVLLVLALAVFSVLTFTSARADLALSKTNADTVQAYYHADQKARAKMADFMAGDADALESTISMTETQNLYIHLARNADGTCKILAWTTVPLDSGDMNLDGDSLPVWDGSTPLS